MVVKIAPQEVDGVLFPREAIPQDAISVHFDGENYTVELPDPPTEEPTE